MIEVQFGSFVVALRFPMVERVIASATDVAKHACLGFIAGYTQSGATRSS